MKQKWLVLVVLCLFVFGSLPGVWAGEIISVKGKVEIQKAKSEAWRAARKYNYVGTGDSVRTGENGKAEISLNKTGSNLVRLEPNSVMTISEIDYNGSGEVKLTQGALFSRVDKAKCTKFQVRTPNSVAGVRGTFWWIGLVEAVCKIAVYSGTVEVAGYDAGGNTTGQTTVDAGQQVSVSQNQAPGPVGSISPEQMKSVEPVAQELDAKAEEQGQSAADEEAGKSSSGGDSGGDSGGSCE